MLDKRRLLNNCGCVIELFECVRAIEKPYLLISVLEFFAKDEKILYISLMLEVLQLCTTVNLFLDQINRDVELLQRTAIDVGELDFDCVFHVEENNTISAKSRNKKNQILRTLCVIRIMWSRGGPGPVNQKPRLRGGVFYYFLFDIASIATTTSMMSIIHG